MTATMEEKSTQGGGQASGRVARVIGPVLDVEFPTDAVPDMYNALTVQTSFEGSEETLTLEVAQHLGDGIVRAISLRPTDGVVRGSEVVNTEQSIQVPVGDETLGRVFNTVGQCLNLDEGEEFHAQEHWGIHRSAPRSEERRVGKECRARMSGDGGRTNSGA